MENATKTGKRKFPEKCWQDCLRKPKNGMSGKIYRQKEE